VEYNIPLEKSIEQNLIPGGNKLGTKEQTIIGPGTNYDHPITREKKFTRNKLLKNKKMKNKYKIEKAYPK
jgi:hypothetical protein